LTFDIHIFCV